MRKTTWTRLCLIVLCIVMFTSMFACGKGSEETTDNKAVETTEKADQTTAEKPVETTETGNEVTNDENTLVTTEKTPEETTEKTTEETTEKTTEETTEANTELTTEKPVETTETEKPSVLETAEIYADDLIDEMQYMLAGDTVLKETIMFLEYGEIKSLLFSVDQIVSVTSYGGGVVYEEGVDYALVDGKIKLLEGSRIPCITKDVFYNNKTNSNTHVTYVDGEQVNTYCGEGTKMTQWQVSVTYKHSDEWNGNEIPCMSEVYEELILKLINGEDVTIVFYGDSITRGANASQYVNTEPYLYSYPLLFTYSIADLFDYSVEHIYTGQNQTFGAVSTQMHEIVGTYVAGDRGTITFINAAVGGWATPNGIGNVKNYVTDYTDVYGCDLFVCAFGMNDGLNSPSGYVNNTETIIDAVLASAPDTSVMMVATVLAHPDSATGWAGNQINFETPLIESARKYVENGIPCAVAPVTSVSKVMLESKLYHDISANNINHPNDFFGRVYAQTMLQTLIGYENLKSDKPAKEQEVHKTGLSAAFDEESGKYYLVCKDCGEMTSVESQFNYVFDLAVVAGTQSATVSPLKIDPDTGVAYRKYKPEVTTGPSVSWQIMVHDSTKFAPTAPTGQYLVIKYRVDTMRKNAHISLSFNCLGGSKTAKENIAITANEMWQYLVVDLAELYPSNIVKHSDGNYWINQMTLSWTTEGLRSIDIAFIAYSDNLEYINSVIEADDTISDEIPGGDEGECQHSPSAFKAIWNIEEKKYYATCVLCGEPSDTVADFSLIINDLTATAGNSHCVWTKQSDDNGNEFYKLVVYNASSGWTTTQFNFNMDEYITGGYMLFKYRIPKGSDMKGFSIRMYTSGGAKQTDAQASLINDGEWHIAAVDFTSLGNELSYMLFPLNPMSGFDCEWIAFAEDADYVSEYLREHGGVEEDNTDPEGHTPSAKEGVWNPVDKKYYAKCTECGEVTSTTLEFAYKITDFAAECDGQTSSLWNPKIGFYEWVKYSSAATSIFNFDESAQLKGYIVIKYSSLVNNTIGAFDIKVTSSGSDSPVTKTVEAISDTKWHVVVIDVSELEGYITKIEFPLNVGCTFSNFMWLGFAEDMEYAYSMAEN